MMGLPLAFAAPAVLAALVALPVIWWLLRLTPPRPRPETFPPTRLLLEIVRKEETPSKSPWWLTLLRLLLAAIVIVALAGPIFRPVAEEAPGEGPLLLVIDNGWAAAPRWEATRETARRIVELAASAERPVSLVASADGPAQQLEPTDPDEAGRRLEALLPRPRPDDRTALIAPLERGAAAAGFGGVAWLTDDLGGADAEAFAAFLSTALPVPTIAYHDAGSQTLGIAGPNSTSEALTAPVVRRNPSAPAAGIVLARDLKGRVIGEAPFDFAAGETTTPAAFTLPSELRNEIVRLEISGEESAGAVQLLDERFRRRTIGVISGANADVAQPLLAPDYYLTRAVQPFADVRLPGDNNAGTAISTMIDDGISVIAMADIGTLAPEVEGKLAAWVENGGTLIRFAGPRLAAAADALTPVRLRQGGRTLGGSLSWETPQPLGLFPDAGPFAGLPVPADVAVKRQVLAEPDAALADRVWATLADGTPLVTAAPTGDGLLILFHVTADTTWSNLPLSGTFVEMLRRIVALSQAARATEADPEADAVGVLPPYRVLDGFGRFALPGESVRPVPANATDAIIGLDHPPGLYGSEEGFRAVNLLQPDATLPAFDPSFLEEATVRAYPGSSPVDLAPWLLAAALALLILDALAVLWLAGAFHVRRRAAAAIVAGMIVIGMSASAPRDAVAQEPAPDPAADLRAIEATSQTRLAYVMTGNPATDAISRAGLLGLTRVLVDRTALEPGDPVGVDVATDELAFYPLLYWPIDVTAPLPSSATVARIDAYMKSGGSILFDTRDQIDRAPGQGFSGTPAADRLREMLSTLDLPPLEPVPADHVLTKAFYLLADFPGRYAGGDLWVEALPEEPDIPDDRPARAGDGVTPILITSNNFAAAWAIDDSGAFMFPTVPPVRNQREMAFRVGVNIVMYTLTGNYKADQVHVPALLERLGQ